MAWYGRTIAMAMRKGSMTRLTRYSTWNRSKYAKEDQFSGQIHFGGSVKSWMVAHVLQIQIRKYTVNSVLDYGSQIIMWSRLDLPSALLAFSCVLPAFAEQLEIRDTIPAPYIFTSDQDWNGIDGNWSTFTIEVGTPSQSIQTLLSWSSYQTWVVIPQGCQTATDYTACADVRGGIFQYNKSSTFHKIGTYSLLVDENLDLFSNAIYGYDQVTLAGQGLTLTNTTVAGMALDTFYLGVFGVNTKPTNFTTFNDPSPSYMTQLKQQNKIPSVSFGYTAGAHYRSTGVNASLTLGGYDTSRFDANNVTFNFGSDTDHEIMLALQSISTASKIASSPNQVQLLPSPIYIEIDTTISHLYLPIQACQLFEAEFGLTYDNNTNLYLVNDTLHNSLLDRNPNITFTFGQLISGGQNVHVTLPYAAFDLTAKAGYSGLTTDNRYFPLKRASNSTQYVLGRTFMQEAYITVDYEVSRFQLAQATFDQDSQHIVAIPAANSSQSSDSWTSSTYQPTYSVPSNSTTAPSQNRGLSTGAIAGIAVGVVLGLAAAAIMAWLFVRRQRKRRSASQVMESDNGFPDDGKDKSQVFPKAELAGSDPAEFGLTHHDLDRKALLGSHPPSSAGTAHSPGSGYLNADGTMSSQHSGWPLSPTTPVSEAHSRAIYEMPGDVPETMKDGRELGEKEALQHRERIYNGIDETVDGSSSTEDAAREPRRVAAEDVVNAQTGDHLGRHRAFSFEFDRSETENLTDGSGRTLVDSNASSSDNGSEQREGRTLV
ncbi:hypothetical protein MRB53_039851 [Persea americana]|nr:hypothetical protein MRB53_039851 [Persea americana]